MCCTCVAQEAVIDRMNNNVILMHTLHATFTYAFTVYTPPLVLHIPTLSIITPDYKPLKCSFVYLFFSFIHTYNNC